MPTYKMTWKKTGVADITVNCYNCREVNSRNMYNRTYRFQSVVKILPLQIAKLLINKTPAYS